MQYVELGRVPYTPQKKSGKRKFVKWGLLTLLLGIVIYASYILYWPAFTLLKQIARQPQSVLSLISSPGGELKSTDGRTNYLLVGIDKRAAETYSYKGANGQEIKSGFRTDTIIILSVNKNTHNVAMISIPRDTWVKIPDFGQIKNYYGKINSVYETGEMYNYPDGGGLGLLDKELEDMLGVPIHYSARIDFQGFQEGIDTLGGVDIMVDRTFDDYQYPIEGKEDAICPGGDDYCRFKHLHFNQGLTHMDGETALEYARSREGTNGEGSDFARAKRQQKVLLAAKDKALKFQNLFNPVKLNSLFEELGNSIQTDLDVSALVATYNLGKDVNASKISQLVLDDSANGYLYNPPESQYGGAWVLLPKGGNWDQVKKAVNSLLAPSPAQNQK